MMKRKGKRLPKCSQCHGAIDSAHTATRCIQQRNAVLSLIIF